MTTYTRPLGGGTPATGQVVKAVHVNDPIDQIYDTILAGGITSDQIAVGAVDTSELATAAVTAAKMDGTLPDASAMATSAAPTTDAQLANKKYIDDQILAKVPLSGRVQGRGSVTGSNGTLKEGFNCTTVRDSTGVYTVTWTTNFANANYALVPSLATGSTGTAASTSKATGTAVISTRTLGGAAADRDFDFIAVGLQ